MEWLIHLVVAVVTALLRVVLPAMRPTYEDADPDVTVRDRLRARVRRHWG